ncbi:MAG: AI-2E family transporter [Thermocrinis sp.]|uniref:AI-2E family transporter n=1 Tax=Thermocrinis sp. TaxID=2024383 RepID=UPI003C027755
MERERFFKYSVLTSTLGLLLVVFYILLPFITPILWALVFSLVLYPVHQKLKKLLPWATLSALILTLLTLLVIVLPFGVLGAIILNQAIELSVYLLNFIQNHTYQHYLSYLEALLKKFFHQEQVQIFLNYINSEEFRSLVVGMLKSTSQQLLQLSKNLFTFALSFLFKSFIFLLTLFFILRDGEKFASFVGRFIPMHEEDVREIFGTVYKTVLATAYGSVVVGFAQGLLGAIGYAIAGIKYYPLFGLTTFFASFVPPFGASAVWAPLVAYLFITQSIKSAVFLLIWGMFIISTVDNIVRPLIMKIGVQMPYIVLFFSILGGLIAFGFVGVFLGPIIFTTLFSLFVIYERRILK